MSACSVGKAEYLQVHSGGWMLRSPSARGQWDPCCSLSPLPTKIAAASVLLSFPAASAYAQVHVPPPWVTVPQKDPWVLPVKADLIVHISKCS